MYAYRALPERVRGRATYSSAPLASESAEGMQAYEAFELFKLIDKLPLKICALATWGECITIATAPGGKEFDVCCALFRTQAPAVHWQPCIGLASFI